MPAYGKVTGQLIVRMDLQSGGFFKSATGINKAIRAIKSNLKTLDVQYKASGDKMSYLNNKISQSEELMQTYRERVKQLKKELATMKPDTQAFVKQQNQIRRTEADMSLLESQMKSYRKELLYVDSEIGKVTAKFKSQNAAIKANMARYEMEGNEVKKLVNQKRLLKNQIAENNSVMKSEQAILKRVGDALGRNSAEYQEQKAKLIGLQAQQKRYNAELELTARKARAAAVQQNFYNSRMGNMANAMAKNKNGLIDMRNSFLGLSAAAVGAAYPIARAFTGAIRATVEWEDALSNVEKTTGASQSQMKEYSEDIRKMALRMPETQSEIANTMALAAQLGVKNLKGFTEVATQMGVATNMTSEQAAENMAKFANATGKPDSNFRKLGSTVVQLGNNYCPPTKRFVG